MLGRLVDVAHDISKYLTWKDVFNIAKSAKLGTFDLFVASIKIWRFWYVKKTQHWANQAVRQCLFKNPHFERTIINIGSFHVPCDLDRACRVYRKKRFVILDDFLQCPICKWNDADAVLNFSIGYRLAFCEPHIMFLCRVCAMEEARNIVAYYHPPRISFYGEDDWNDAL